MSKHMGLKPGLCQWEGDGDRVEKGRLLPIALQPEQDYLFPAFYMGLPPTILLKEKVLWLKNV